MTRLSERLSELEALPAGGTLHAMRPWTAAAETVVAEGQSPAGYDYLLEVDLVRDVLETWSGWRGGRAPTQEQAAEAVVHYAERDAYLPVT